MFNVKALQEQHAELVERAQAIANVAKKEQRDLTDEENSEVDDILDKQVPAIKAKIARAEKIEAEQAALASVRSTTTLTLANGPQDVDENSDDGDELPLAARITIPRASAHRFGQLKCYKGENAEKNAYIAGRFIMATLFADEPSRKWCDDHEVDWRPRGALTTGDNTLGGALVPIEMEQAIIDLKEMYGVFRREARNVPMMSDTKWQPRRTSGVTAYFVGDNDQVTASAKAWDSVQLVAKKLAVLCKYSSEIAEDAVISIADDLTQEIAYAFAVKEDSCGFLGDGTSTYGGMTGLINAIAAGSTVTAATGNTAFSTLDLTDFESMVGKLPTYAESNAKWYISKAGYAASMMRLVDAAGGNTIETLQGGANMRTFLGYPVVVSQTMNSTLTAQTSTSGLCYFGDLRQAAMFGNRRGMSILVSPHRYMEYDQIGILGTERFDIVIHEVGTASAAGSVIMLATPGS